MLIRLVLRARFIVIGLMIAVMAVGAYSLTRLKVELLPNIDFPLVTVSAVYPGATADQVLQQVTIPVEDAIKGVANVDTVRSTSAPGLALILVEAPFGKDMKAMEQQIASRVGGLALPAGIKANVARANPDEFPIIEISALGDGSIENLQSILTSQVLPELNKVAGVFSANLPLGAGTGLSITRTNGIPSLAISVLKTSDANTVEVAKAVEARLTSLKATLPSDIQFIEISNQAPSIKSSVSELQREVLLGAILAVAVIFAFLLSFRATLVTSIAIPVSVLGAFIVMHFQGMTLNILTLGGLAIAVGRVVDDSIVVMENVFRHIQMGDDRRTAVINGTREVTVPIITSTATTIAVFLPLALVGGFVAVIFLPFAMVITYALVASLIVSLTIVPVLGSLLIKRSDKEPKENRITRVYATLLSSALAHKKRALVIAAALFLVALALLRFVPLSFLPDSGQQVLSVQMSVPGAQSSADLVKQLDQVEATLANLHSQGMVDNYQSTIGYGGPFGQTGGSDSATIEVQLHDGVKVDQMATQLRQDLAGQGRTISIAQASGGSPSSNNLQMDLLGSDYTLLTSTSAKVVTALQAVPGLKDVKDDAVKAGQANGMVLPISRVDGQRSVTISGTITAQNTQAVQTAVKKAVDQVGLPQGVSVKTGGVFASFNQAFSQMFLAMFMSIILVYLIIVVSRRSFVTPFVIILSLPLASIGAFAALAVTRSALGLPALIGLLMLIGLVVTNAIVLIAFIEQLRARGVPLREALVQGGRTRMRPILMTALTTIFVLLPMALGIGGKSQGIIGAQLAVVVIGGLITSTLLTLLVIPVIYSILRKKEPACARAIVSEPCETVVAEAEEVA
ncbi:MAG: efflux RND transporter permease subunit [Dehalococcoidia bacterium]|nr:efflux RND transporter permease subunit [Dehalococcoidia bacterium]